jgi:hypothetical protein
MRDASTLFDLLADLRRRRLLFLLYETESVRIPEGLGMRGSSASAAGQNGASVGDRSGGETSDLEVAMYHSHLPKLEEAGLIHWDPEEGVVRRGPDYGDVAPVVAVLLENLDAFPADVV